MNKFITIVWASVATPLLGMILAPMAASCGGGDSAPATPPPPPIAVSVTASAPTAAPGTTVTLTASLQNEE